MKLTRTPAGLVALLSGLLALPAQETNQIEQLRLQLRQLEQDFERTQQLQRQQIEALQSQIKALQQQPTPPPPTVPRPDTTPPAEPAPPGAASPGARSGAWSPSAPLTLIGNQQHYLNLSLDALLAAGTSTADDIDRLELGGHDPNQRGFTLQNLEAVFDGAVDPYFRAQANLSFFLDSANESQFELEEAFAETLSLPGNLQVRAGQYLTEFGRLNPTHPHSWDFVDQSLVNGRFFGPDGLRSLGGRIAWLAPTPFYTEAFLSIQNSQGETAYSFRNDHDDALYAGRLNEVGDVESFGDLLFAPRLASSFDLTRSQTVLAGLSAAFGPNASGSGTDTQIYGLDLLWKWKSPTHHGGFPFVSVQTEAMVRRYEAGAFSNDLNGNSILDSGEDLYGDGSLRSLPAETLIDYGLYAQLAWGFKKGWIAALRGDWVQGDTAAFDPDPDRERRCRLAPNLTYYPTEYSKLRVQYNYDDRELEGTDHSVWFQLEFLLGAHAAHKF